MKGRDDRSGFALVLTLVLLALLVLAMYAVSALTRVGADVAANGIRQTQAKQNALLGLSVALGELQRTAGDDDRRTGMAGIAGVAPGPGHPTRHWCGVWDATGALRRWLVSGGEAGSGPNLPIGPVCVMVGEGALGADGTDKEHVHAAYVNLPAAGGRFAWWVGDEGVKLTAVPRAADAAVPGQQHAIDELIPALSPTAPALARVRAYSQLALVPSPVLTPGQLQGNLHALTVTNLGVLNTGERRSGLLNVNTTTARFWRGVAATYNRNRPGGADPLVPATFAAAMRDGVSGADVTAGKAAGVPFRDVESFLASDGLTAAVAGAGGNRDDFAGTMRPWLATRSDTFRIRACGEAVNPAEVTRIESVAWCEAIVERTPDTLPGFGRRFRVTYFRWLGPEDI